MVHRVGVGFGHDRFCVAPRPRDACAHAALPAVNRRPPIDRRRRTVELPLPRRLLTTRPALSPEAESSPASSARGPGRAPFRRPERFGAGSTREPSFTNRIQTHLAKVSELPTTPRERRSERAVNHSPTPVAHSRAHWLPLPDGFANLLYFETWSVWCQSDLGATLTRAQHQCPARFRPVLRRRRIGRSGRPNGKVVGGLEAQNDRPRRER